MNYIIKYLCIFYFYNRNYFVYLLDCKPTNIGIISIFEKEK